MRHTLRLLSLAALASLAACTHEPAGLLADQAALDAADQFQRLADDAFRAGADPDVIVAYHNIARTVMRNGRVSPVTIAVDGAPTEFLATARQVELDAGPTCAQPGSLCLLLPALRSVIAWQRSDPRRVVQLTASAGTTEIGRVVPGAGGGAFLNTATLTYFDGAGGFYVGTSGTQNIGDPVLSDTPCHVSSEPTPDAAPQQARCTLAEFTASFNGTVAPPPFTVRNNTATGTHTISLASQRIHGSRLVMTAALPICPSCENGYPRELLPPIDLRGGALPATLSVAASATEVTFTLRITNPLPTPATIQFTSGQQFDVRVRRYDGTPVWTWSADKLFIAALGSRTLASGETATYAATWTPTAHGNLLAEGRLTSSSHRAEATSGFVAP